jgi:methanogenic corrinoid protein MtbC1
MTTDRNPSRSASPVPEDTPFVSIGGLSRATGVPIETLRTWESRYGFPKSVRKPSGHRLFDLGSVERIRRIAFALERGLRAGDVVPAPEAALAALLATIPEKAAPRPPVAPIDARAFIDHIRRFDADRLMRSMHSDLAHEDPVAYLETRITPGLEVLGAAWEKGEIEIAHEHFASERISDVLRVARMRFEETATGPLIALATLPGESHGLGVQMAALILAARGLRILSLGTEVPVTEIAALVVRTGASAVAISVSTASARTAVLPLTALRAALPRRAELVLGGAGAPTNIKGTVVLGSLRDLDVWAEAHARGAARR